jgi:hypothetical protein
MDAECADGFRRVPVSLGANDLVRTATCVNGPHLVALVRAGAVLRKGVLVENPTEDQVAA